MFAYRLVHYKPTVQNGIFGVLCCLTLSEFILTLLTHSLVLRSVLSHSIAICFTCALPLVQGIKSFASTKPSLCTVWTVTCGVALAGLCLVDLIHAVKMLIFRHDSGVHLPHFLVAVSVLELLTKNLLLWFDSAAGSDFASLTTRKKQKVIKKGKISIVATTPPPTSAPQKHVHFLFPEQNGKDEKEPAHEKWLPVDRWLSFMFYLSPGIGLLFISLLRLLLNSEHLVLWIDPSLTILLCGVWWFSIWPVFHANVMALMLSVPGRLEVDKLIQRLEDQFPQYRIHHLHLWEEDGVLRITLHVVLSDCNCGGGQQTLKMTSQVVEATIAKPVLPVCECVAQVTKTLSSFLRFHGIEYITVQPELSKARYRNAECHLQCPRVSCTEHRCCAVGSDLDSKLPALRRGIRLRRKYLGTSSWDSDRVSWSENEEDNLSIY